MAPESRLVQRSERRPVTAQDARPPTSRVRRLADGGVGAIVLFSLVEDQLRERATRAIRLVEDTAESFPEAIG
jgi:hypothetical protein